MTGRQHLLNQGKTKSAYKWLKRGAVDPDRGFEWSIRPVPWAAPVPTRLTAVYAYLPAGLAYEVDDELWEVVLQDVIGYQPFPHQKTEGHHQEFEQHEQRIFALRGYLVRRIQEWTPEVAEELARECALEARARALTGLQDATQWLEDAQATEQAVNGSTIVGAPGGLTHTACEEPRAHEREAIVLSQARRLLSIWCSARSADGSQAQIAAAHAAAAAASRSAAALTYATLIDPGEIDAATEAAARAYAEERRHQARWLQERLGLQDPDVGAVALDVA